MAYKQKYVIGDTYAFYQNFGSLSNSTFFASWVLQLIHADSDPPEGGTGNPVIGSVTTLVKDIISGSSFRWYVNDFTFPSVPVGCYKWRVYDPVDEGQIWRSDEFEVVDSRDGLIRARYRNAKNILGYNYETLTSFYEKRNFELKVRKPIIKESAEGYAKVDSSFKRVRTTLVTTREFVTGWYDQLEHKAFHEAMIHSDFQLLYEGVQTASMMLNTIWFSLTKPEDAEYEPDWQEDYEYIQAVVRLQEEDSGSSNEAV